MIKKRYLMLLSVAVVSILLGTLSYNYVTLAEREREPTAVEVVNLPIDEQGNLKTTTVPTSKSMLVFNESLTVPSNPQNYIYLTSFNTSGYKYAVIMAKGQGTWEEGAAINIWFFENSFGIQTIPVGIGDISLYTAMTTRPDHGCAVSSRYQVHSTSTDLYLQVYNSNVGFDGLLTIVAYLSN